MPLEEYSRPSPVRRGEDARSVFSSHPPSATLQLPAAALSQASHLYPARTPSLLPWHINILVPLSPIHVSTYSDLHISTASLPSFSLSLHFPFLSPLPLPFPSPSHLRVSLSPASSSSSKRLFHSSYMFLICNSPRGVCNPRLPVLTVIPYVYNVK